jgi:hypothetical protein
MDSVTRALMNDFAVENGLAGLDQSKKFEHFAAYSVVSARHTDDFETDDLVVGDGGDLNVDAFAVKVNGRIATDPDTVKDLLDLNGYLDVEFMIIQAKTSSNFDGSAIISLGDNLVNEVFSEKQTLPFNSDVKRLIEIKDMVFRHASKLRDNPSCRVYYVCTGNWVEDDYLQGVINRKCQDLKNTNLFSHVEFTPVGAQALQKMYRATKTSISREVRFEKLVTLPAISNVNASYLGVLPVGEYLKLISDEGGEILKSVFVDNVRDFQGDNPVNADIAKTLQDGMFDQFVLRNNGITIVSRNIKVTSSQFTLEDYQVVNGCQTSHVIYANRNLISEEMFVPVKLIHTESDDVAQAIIKSTNKQTKVEDNDLLALTQFQRNLEDYFSGFEGDLKLYYERRAKQFANTSGLEKGRITTIGSQLKSFASMFLASAHQAGRYQGTLLKAVKDRVFQPDHKPETYYTAAFAYYRFEVCLRKLPPEDRAIRSFRYFLLSAFRFRFEDRDFLGAGHKKISSYVGQLNSQLEDQEAAKDAFNECVSIVAEALSNLALPLERDNAKSKPLVDEVERIARARNPKQQAIVS